MTRPKKKTETLAWAMTVGGELCVSQSLVLAVATETLVFITVLLQNKDGMEVTALQINPI